jgi:hypothetical protein
MQQQEEKENYPSNNNNITNREMMMLHSLHHQALLSMQVSHISFPCDEHAIFVEFSHWIHPPFV